jgi:hypothetical protein
MTYVEYLDRGEQVLRDSLVWHRANSNHLPEKQFQAFEAGFREAWRKACTFGLVRLSQFERQRNIVG